jgi:hypothetical protein
MGNTSSCVDKVSDEEALKWLQMHTSSLFDEAYLKIANDNLPQYVKDHFSAETKNEEKDGQGKSNDNAVSRLLMEFLGPLSQQTVYADVVEDSAAGGGANSEDSVETLQKVSIDIFFETFCVCGDIHSY